MSQTSDFIASSDNNLSIDIQFNQQCCEMSGAEYEVN